MTNRGIEWWNIIDVVFRRPEELPEYYDNNRMLFMLFFTWWIMIVAQIMMGIVVFWITYPEFRFVILSLVGAYSLITGVHEIRRRIKK